MVKTYTCKNFDAETNQCQVYNERPDICRTTSCINPESPASLEEQYQEVTEQKFLKIPKPPSR